MKKAFQLDVDEQGIATLCFDYPEQKVNKLSGWVMDELSTTLDELALRSDIKAMVIKSAKKGIFIAGADIEEFVQLQAKGMDAALKELPPGQEIFNKLESLPFPTLAVIDGACMGGGMELALACSFRIATDDPKTKMGLPEVNLGIIPGWGGTQRMPRLIGIIQSLGLILPGKPVNARKALKLHLVDSVAAPEFLHEEIKRFVDCILTPKGREKINKQRERKGVQNYLLEKTLPGRSYVFSKARKDLLKKTKGHYPAPVKALEAIEEGMKVSLKEGLSIEKKAFQSFTPQGFSIFKNLVRIFFTDQALKKETGVKEEVEPKKIQKAAVLGAGVMGGGIAWAFSNKGIPVRIKDINWDAVALGFQAAGKINQQLMKKRKLKPWKENLNMHLISGTTDYAGFKQHDMVVEAIVENMELKKKVLAELENEVRDDCIICSNTSVLSITEMAKALKHPERFVGMHFFNPVNRMPLVEIIPGKQTSPETVASAVAMVKKLGKTPVVVGDCPGFLVNRILLPYMMEAVLMFEEGIEYQHIDRLHTDFGMPMGPFLLSDEVGLDVCAKVCTLIGKTQKDVIVPHLLQAINDRGLLGKKGGKGFYVHKGKSSEPNPEISQIQAPPAVQPRLTNGEILDRTLLLMVNEAAKCLEEGIVAKPEYLDMAMIMGTGFPPFRGGLLAYADELGADRVVSKLERLAQAHGDRFKPAKLLQDCAKNGKKLYDFQVEPKAKPRKSRKLAETNA